MENNVKTLTYKGLTWIDIESPNKENIKFLEEKFGFHELDLEDLESRKIQRSKIDEYENYLFIVIHLPIYHKGRDRIISAQLDVFVGQGYFITIRSQMLRSVEKLFEKCHKTISDRKEFMAKGSGFLLYNVISNLFDDCFPLLDEFENEINTMEKEIFHAHFENRDMFKDILLFKKDLITLNRIIFPQRTVLAQLEHKNKKFMSEELEVYFDDVVDKIEKIWNNIENLQQMVESLLDINESVISHNTNKIIKTLTAFSVIILPLTLLSGIYGMNLTRLPWADRPDSFNLIIGFMLFIAVFMLVFFKFRRWL